MKRKEKATQRYIVCLLSSVDSFLQKIAFMAHNVLNIQTLPFWHNFMSACQFDDDI